MERFFEIRTNAPVNQTFAVIDGAGGYEVLDPDDTFRMDIRKDKGDPDPPIFRFETGDAAQSISVFLDADDGIWKFHVETAEDDVVLNAMIAALEPGTYVADILRTNSPGFEGEFKPVVIKGVTTPPWL
jgi:hypothetical protein